MAEDADTGPLSPYRGLDLADEKGFFCGKILADLGADVIKVERPGGDPARGIGPFYHDIPHPENSLYWFAYNNNKRSITLDIETNAGRGIFRRLVKRADFVVESFPPGYMADLDLDYAALSLLNPRMIMTSITPFGQAGPYRDYRSSDIVSMAMSGFMNLCGDPDRPPVRLSFPQAYLHAGMEAAMGTATAIYYRTVTGEGQYVDVSTQGSICLATLNARFFWDGLKVNLQRSGSFRSGLSQLATLRTVWLCKDGYVAFTLLGGPIGARTNRPLVQWMDAEGKSTEFLNGWQWETFDYSLATVEQFQQLSEPIGRFFLGHSMAELHAGAVERNIMLYPLHTVEGMLEDQQLLARGFWQEIEHPGLAGTVTYPGPFVKSSEYAVKIYRRPPGIGEHNQEIYGDELGLSKEELALLREKSVI